MKIAELQLLEACDVVAAHVRRVVSGHYKTLETTLYIKSARIVLNSLLSDLSFLESCKADGITVSTQTRARIMASCKRLLRDYIYLDELTGD